MTWNWKDLDGRGKIGWKALDVAVTTTAGLGLGV